MSTELDAKGPFYLTRFWGGNERGPCLQLTRRMFGFDERGLFVDLPLSEIPALIADLQAVADGTIGSDDET